MKGYLFCSLCLLFGLLSVAKAEVFTTSDGYRFEVNLIPDKAEIMLGEPIFLSFEIRNLSNVDLSFPEGGDYRNRLGRPESYKIKSTRIDGKEVPVPQIDMHFGGLIGERKVKKNGGIQVIRLFLPLWSPFAETGEYNIVCEKSLSLGNDEDKPKNLRFSFKNATSVTVKTKLKVVKKNQSKFGEIIKYWGEEIFNTTANNRGYEAVRALEYIDDQRVVAPLIKAVRSEKEFSVRDSAIRLLGKFNHARAFEAIISQMNHPVNSIRSSVVTALSTIQNPKAFEFILKLRNDEDKWVRLSVMQALGRKKTSQSIEIIKEMLKEGRNKELFEFVKIYLEKPNQ